MLKDQISFNHLLETSLVQGQETFVEEVHLLERGRRSNRADGFGPVDLSHVNLIVQTETDRSSHSTFEESSRETGMISV